MISDFIIESLISELKSFLLTKGEDSFK
jgi:hypothetical protein